jgi:Calcineurin-like phosphoesterase
VVEIVIGDVHARCRALRALLEAVGAVDGRGRRQGRCWIVQLGDLLDRRASARANLATARLAAGAIDVVLAGNHEARILREPASRHGAALATLAARGWPHAATATGEWLVTHAGVHPELARGLSGRAAECAEEINDRWHRRSACDDGDPLFDWIGPTRGGDAPHGGIFWTHPGEWRSDVEPPWGQIVGHVPQPAPRLLVGRRWAIDLGGRHGRLAALVRASAEERWRPVVVRAH